MLLWNVGNYVIKRQGKRYIIIESRPSWDNKFNLSLHQEAIKEIIFWKTNKIKNKKVIKEYEIPSLLVYSDASNSGLVSVYKEKGKANICYKNWVSPGEN